MLSVVRRKLKSSEYPYKYGKVILILGPEYQITFWCGLFLYLFFKRRKSTLLLVSRVEPQQDFKNDLDISVYSAVMSSRRKVRIFQGCPNDCATTDISRTNWLFKKTPYF